MKIDSLFTKISIIFVLATVLLMGLFLFYLKYETQLQSSPVISNHKNIALNIMAKRLPPREIVSFLEDLNFEYVENGRQIMSKTKILVREKGFETLIVEGKYYFHFLGPSFRILFKDLKKYEKSNLAYAIFIILLLGLVLLYFWLIKSLQPLKELKNSISEFSKGDLSINCKSDKKDEIAQVANEFDNAVRKIELLLDSRQLFLRTVMHELKTPIAKGRIVSELVEDEKQKNRMVLIFEKLDSLINDFAKVEQVVSQNYEIQKHNFYLDELMENSKKLLMLENIDENVQVVIKEEYKIAADYDLMSMVFKNLIDNALKYSDDKKINIVGNADSIEFTSKGKKLEKPFEEYFKPFHNTTKSKNHGMGLGIYIVKSILDMHKMKFEYEYYDESNIFKILYTDEEEN